MITRLVTMVPLTVCENGHILKRDTSNAVEAEQFLNSCGHWVWMDANYCGQCGVPVDKERP